MSSIVVRSVAKVVTWNTSRCVMQRMIQQVELVSLVGTVFVHAFVHAEEVFRRKWSYLIGCSDQP